MVLDEKNKQLITKNKKINLSSREFLFLDFLIQHKYQACSYNEIMKYIYDIDDSAINYFKTTFKVLLRRIRKKLENEDFVITTINGFGIFTYYNIDVTVKKRFDIFYKELEIKQLKKEINEKKQEIYALEESLK